MKRGSLSVSVAAGEHQTYLQAWTLLAILTLLSSMLAWSAIAAKPVLANTGPGTKLGFTVNPNSSYTADDAINVTVAIQDDGGDTVDEGSGSIGNITLQATGGAVIEETDLIQAADAGVASFEIHIRNAGGGYGLKATSGELAEGTSSTFGVTAGALASTVLTPDPETENADVGEVTYTATGADAYGNDKGNVTAEVTFDISGSDSSCTGNACGSRKTGSYTVSDSTNSGTASLTITPGALDYFVVETSPTSPATTYVAGASFDVTVTAYDAWDNVKTDYNETATVSGLASSPGCADCSPVAPKAAEYGSTTITFSSGVAVTTATGFLAGSGQAITATGDETATSDAFTILPAALHHFTWSAITTPQTANAPFSIEAKAFDTYGNLKTNYNASPTLSALAASPNGTSSTFPTTLTFLSGVGSASGKAFKASAFASGVYTADQSFTVTDVSVTRTSGSFAVQSAALDRLEFAAVAGTATTPAFGGGQPIDTKFNSVIYSSCNAAPAGSADPCLATSSPVKVLALDAYGNRKPNVSVGITRQAVAPSTFLGTFVGTQPKNTSGGGGSNPPLGEAWFSDLRIQTISGSATDRYTLTATSGSTTRISSNFRIVSDLANCTGQTKCFNNTKNNSVDKPENSYSQSKTTVGNFGNVITTTNFSDPTLDVNGQCTGVRTNSTIGSAIDVRVVGAGLATSKPTSTMVMVLPIKTLKFYGLTARNADSYNVCLGAINLNGSTSNSDAWIGKDKKNKALAASQGIDADGLNRFWGVPAECGQKYLRATDPCISLKTKSASAVAARMTQVTGETWTVARVNSELNYFDGDIAIFVTKPFPWDGKSGLY